MSLTNKKPILITGSHRSGSTWTGYVLAKAPNIKYVNEPFNVWLKHKGFPFKNWFAHMDKSASKQKQQQVEEYIKRFYKFSFTQAIEGQKLYTLEGTYRAIRALRTRLYFRPLLKDPIAFFSAEWIYQTFQADVVVLVRHPAALVASLKVKNWTFDFNNLLRQPKLMDTYLSEFSTDIEAFSKENKSIIEQGALLWNIIYATVIKYKEKYNETWYFVTHEDLSKNPMDEFEKLCGFLNLSFTQKIKNHIEITTKSTIEKGHKRNSKANIKTWQERLTKEEIAYVKEQTKINWQHFYAETDWQDD